MDIEIKDAVGYGGLIEKITAKLTIGGPDPRNPCWEWNGAMTKKKLGYGRVSWMGKSYLPHRVILANSRGLHISEWPTGKISRHVFCANHRCCNPSHMEFGTQAENVMDTIRDGRNAHLSKVKCPRGHNLVDGNLVQAKLPHRSCLVCLRATSDVRVNRIRHQRCISTEEAVEIQRIRHPDTWEIATATL